jgi:TonB family protein
MTTKSIRGFQGGFRQSMSWLHTWAGLLLAIVLYFMFITGTVGYFNREIDRWMQPELPFISSAERENLQSIGQQNALLQKASIALQTRAPKAQQWYFDLPHTDRGGEYLSAYADPLSLKINPLTGAVIHTRLTGGGSALYSMHYALHYLPGTLAMYLVGIATMFMLVGIISGVIVHKKIFTDFFTFRPGKKQRSWLDAHNASSVLALPFMIMITYSGLMFYLYEYMPSVKTIFYGAGESGYTAMEKERGSIYLERQTRQPSGSKIAAASFAPMLAIAEAQWGAGQVRYVNVLHPGDRRAVVTFERAQHGLRSGGGTLQFNGVTGELRQTPEPSNSASAPDRFNEIMFALHEGRFAGALLRWFYFATGLLGAAMVATGMILWTSKRRQQLGKSGKAEAGLRFVERLNVGAIVGLLAGIAGYFWANRLLPLHLEDRDALEMHTLFITWLLFFIHGTVRDMKQVWIEQLALSGALFMTLPLLNALTTEKHLLATVTSGDWTLASFDFAALLLGIVLISIAVKIHRSVTQVKITPAVHLQPRIVAITFIIALHIGLLSLLFISPRNSLPIQPAAPIQVQLIQTTQAAEPIPEVTPELVDAAIEVPLPEIAVTLNEPVATLQVAKPIATSSVAEATSPRIIAARFDADYLDNPAPQYPAVSRRRGEEGIVLIRAHVRADGSPAEVRLQQTSGHPRLDAAALTAVKQWRFVPAKRGVDAVESWVVVPVEFNLRA